MNFHKCLTMAIMMSRSGLAQRNSAWLFQRQCLRNRISTAFVLPLQRHASNTPSKPKVLEKPSKFNPPSHPSRLVKQPTYRHYGPDLTEERKLELDMTEFPHMLPPAGTWKHWFLTSRLFHTWFALVSPNLICCDRSNYFRADLSSPSGS